MPLALFDILTGDSAGEHAAPTLDQQVASVQRHLGRLLNARRGSLAHLPDYGLPDLGAVYDNLPYSVEALARTVAGLIEAYEPRLSQVRVRQAAPAGGDRRIQLEIRASLAGCGPVRFQTIFESIGNARVHPATAGGAHA